MKYKKSTIFQTGITVLVLVGLGLTLYLAQRTQTYRGKALEADQTFTLNDSNTGSPVDCTGTVCTTTAESVNIKIEDSQIPGLLNELP